MKKYSVESVVGIFVVIGLLCVAYMTVKLGKVSLVSETITIRSMHVLHRYRDCGWAVL